MISPLAVATRNGLNSKAMEAQQRLVALLTPYLGRKIRKISGYGGWVAAVDRDLDRFRAELQAEGFRGWLACQSTWCHLQIDITYRLPDTNHCSYVKANLSICKVDEAGLLVEIFPLAERRTDYTLEWVEAVSAEARKLEDKLSQLRQSIREFTQ